MHMCEINLNVTKNKRKNSKSTKPPLNLSMHIFEDDLKALTNLWIGPSAK